MSIGMLAVSEPANNAVASRGVKKAAQDGDSSPSGFKELVGDQKGEKKTNPDASASGTEEGQLIWRQYGLVIGSGDTGKNPLESEETAALLEPGEAGDDAQATDAVVATTVDTTISTIAEADVENATEMPVQADAIAEQIGQGVEAAPTEPANAAAQGTAVAEQIAATAAASAATPASGLKPEAAQGKSQVRGEPANNTQNSAQMAALQQAAADADGAGIGADGGRQDQGRGNQNDAALEKIAQIAGSRPVSNVSVIGNQIAPAPVQAMPMSETGSAFATSLAAEVLPGDRADPTAQSSLTQNFGKAAPITTLKIQLHPAELGMVTARLSGTENQLSIAITVDNAEARHRLTADADAIISALKGMGIDVDRVTIQQQQPGSGASPNGDSRGGEFRQSGESRGEGQGQSSRQGSGSGNDENSQKSPAAARSDAAVGGVYI